MKEARTRALIRRAIEGLQREGAPLEVLARSQVRARCAEWMKQKEGLLEREIPKPRSFERHLAGVLAEILADNSIG